MNMAKAIDAKQNRLLQWNVVPYVFRRYYSGDVTVKSFQFLECYYAVLGWPIAEEFSIHSFLPHSSPGVSNVTNAYGTFPEPIGSNEERNRNVLSLTLVSTQLHWYHWTSKCHFSLVEHNVFRILFCQCFNFSLKSLFRMPFYFFSNNGISFSVVIN